MKTQTGQLTTAKTYQSKQDSSARFPVWQRVAISVSITLQLKIITSRTDDSVAP